MSSELVARRLALRAVEQSCSGMGLRSRRCLQNNQMLCFALRVSEKPSWAGVAFGGMARWATSASVALAEHGFSLTLARLLSQAHLGLRRNDGVLPGSRTLRGNVAGQRLAMLSNWRIFPA